MTKRMFGRVGAVLLGLLNSAVPARAPAPIPEMTLRRDVGWFSFGIVFSTLGSIRNNVGPPMHSRPCPTHEDPKQLARKTLLIFFFLFFLCCFFCGVFVF